MIKGCAWAFNLLYYLEFFYSSSRKIGNIQPFPYHDTYVNAKQEIHLSTKFNKKQIPCNCKETFTKESFKNNNLEVA